MSNKGIILIKIEYLERTEKRSHFLTFKSMLHKVNYHIIFYYYYTSESFTLLGIRSAEPYLLQCRIHIHPDSQYHFRIYIPFKIECRNASQSRLSSFNYIWQQIL